MFKCPDQYRITRGAAATKAGSTFGAFMVPSMLTTAYLQVIAHDGRNDLGVPVWEHVSVSLEDRTPAWSEMCMVKALFWDPEDTVIQFHPPASQYVNLHPHCLHLWRPVGFEVPTPPTFLIGPKT